MQEQLQEQKEEQVQEQLQEQWQVIPPDFHDPQTESIVDIIGRNNKKRKKVVETTVPMFLKEVSSPSVRMPGTDQQFVEAIRKSQDNMINKINSFQAYLEKTGLDKLETYDNFTVRNKNSPFFIPFIFAYFWWFTVGTWHNKYIDVRDPPLLDGINKGAKKNLNKFGEKQSKDEGFQDWLKQIREYNIARISKKNPQPRQEWKHFIDNINTVFSSGRRIGRSRE